MDELNDPVQLWFTHHVDTVYRSLDALQGPLAAATWSIRDTFLAGGKLLTGGSGSGCALSQLFSSTLLSRLSMERPPLPVVPVGNDPVVLGAISDGYGYPEALARHIQAVASPGDTVLLVTAATGGGLARPSAQRRRGRRGSSFWEGWLVRTPANYQERTISRSGFPPRSQRESVNASC